MLQFLRISGFLVIMSLFSFNGAIITSCLTIFIISVALNCAKMWKGEHIVDEVSNYTFNKGSYYMKHKKPIRGIVYLITPSILILGIIFLILSLGCMWRMVISGVKI